MKTNFTRRDAMKSMAALTGGTAAVGLSLPEAHAAKRVEAWDRGVERGLNWVKKTQSTLGHWTAGGYPVAMTALAGTALLSSGSTATQGPFARAISLAVDYLISKSQPNGLIGDPKRDRRYTYGHGFSMLFLSQVLGEEEDEARREQLIRVLQKAVKFSGEAQTKSGGWGYVSAKDGSNFDEGSTTITQVQGLRGCRNAGIPVDKKVVDDAIKYIYDCQNPDGGICYSSRNRGSSRPAITAAALAALFNAGEYQGEKVKKMLDYTKNKLYNIGAGAFGHWHYTYLYYAQVVYREGAKRGNLDFWQNFRDRLYNKIIAQQNSEGYWQGNIGPIYVTAMNLTILQLDKGYLPIYQR